MNDQPTRTVFFISDGTGITAETLGHSLLTQFEGLRFRQVRIPFVSTTKKAEECVAEIRRAHQQDGLRPIVVTTLVNPDISATLRLADALFVNFFETFIAPLEQELGVKSTHTIGRSHSAVNTQDYFNRIDAVNFSMAHDDGLSPEDLDPADVILVGVSRCGKTPTSLYLALQFGVKAANYPLIPDDFDRRRLPEGLQKHRRKLFGLTISPERLHKIRTERRPNSRYASLENCRDEVTHAEKLMRREGIRWLDSTTKSIEEIAATIIEEIRLDRHVF